ncbi:MAG: helix-turn-helix domain-containing protein [Muribaculaceae bacterium]|nr:helix-turn-helix domain-containing protein [Muribaculaceae bacterium]
MPHTHDSSVADRIRFLIEKLHLNQTKFARLLNLDPANLSKAINGKLPITQGLVNRIAADFGVSKRWLAQGEGLPFEKSQPVPHVSPSLTSGREVPVYDIDVTAGCSELSREFTTDRIIGSVILPSVKPGSVIVRVSGDSMQPDILDGSYIAVRPVTDPDCIFWGQIYVVVMDDYRMVKRVRRHSNPGMLTLTSSNPLYDPIDIPRTKVRSMYIVEAILNLKLQC